MMRRLGVALAILGGVLVLGTVGFAVIERLSLLDALYMTVITVSTTGFREVTPLSPEGRVFTIALILAGVGSLGYSLGTLIDFMVEGHLRGILEGRRMQSRISGLSGHYVVAGIGRVGSVVARTLDEERVPFVVIEASEEAADAARKEGWLVVEGDATDEASLLAAGIERAAGLITALDTDADNLFVTFSARTVSPSLFIVSRSSTETTEAKLRSAGANRVMTPSVIGGRRMATMALHPVVSDYLELVTHGDEIEFRLEEVDVRKGSTIAGHTIREAKIRDVTGAYILAIRGTDGIINSNPSPETRMLPGDKLVVLGTREQLAELDKLV